MKLNRVVSTVDLSHEEWLKHRKGGIGGSDAGAICGLNKYVSPMNVFIDKTQPSTEDFDNEAMRQGRDLEQYVAERFCEATGKKVRRANAIFNNVEYPFMYANVDRLIVGENAGLECKTASIYSADKWKDGKIPESYEIQCLHYMAVTGADAWYIACVILGKEFVFRKIERDEETIQFLVNIEKEFWEENILKNVMPAPDGSEAATELINKKYSDVKAGSEIDIDILDERLARRSEIIGLEKKLKTERDQIEQELKLHMQENEIGVSNNFAATWKGVTSSRVDSKKLKSVFPEIYSQVVKESTSRRLIIKEIVREA